MIGIFQLFFCDEFSRGQTYSNLLFPSYDPTQTSKYADVEYSLMLQGPLLLQWFWVVGFGYPNTLEH